MFEFQDFLDWVKLTVTGNDWIFSRGAWNDTADTYTKFICAVKQNGGAVSGLLKTDNFEVWVIGRRGQRGDVIAVESMANALLLASKSGVIPCNSVDVRLISGPTGPAYTDENRAWYSLNFQVIH